jgi:hypothetical protein
MRKFVLPLIAGVVGMLVMGAARHSDSFAEERAKIETLQARYMFAMDFRDADAYAACFTADGMIDAARGVEKGRKAIHDGIIAMKQHALEQAAQDPSAQRPARKRHSITNVVLKIDGNKAVGRAYWIEIDNNADRSHPQVVGYGHYEDELVKQNGEWYFSKRTIFNETAAARAAPEKLPAW